MGRLFGTDGIRGIANVDLKPELAFQVGRAASYVLGKNRKGKIVIGKDTRYSGDMLEAALIAGIVSMGIDVVRLGVISTPAIAYLTRENQALAGIVISASHNPGEYNGIKIFNEEGLKLTDEIEAEIEDIILNNIEIDARPIKDEIGSITVLENGGDMYLDYLISKIGVDLTGVKVAMDCGNGALSKIGPWAIERLGGQVVAINTQPNGMNINDNCGSTNPKMIQDLVLEIKADIGISFDGDGDRIIACDELGNIIDGDHILAICSKYFKKIGKLKKDTVVGTIMTNMGLDDYLINSGMKIVKTKVGDRYILEEMIREGYSLGGEQSGHIIILEYNTTGDGLATGLQLLKVARESNKKLSELNNLMTNYPQVLVNARVKEELKYSYSENEEIMEAIRQVEDKFMGKGRVIIRPSGTEPLVRVMIESKGDGIEGIAHDLANFIEARIG